jgi:hypothetical protein
VNDLARVFPAPAAGPALAGQELTTIQKAIARALDERLPRLAAELDADLRAALFGPQKRLLAALCEGHETRTVCHGLSKAARYRVLQTLQEADVVGALLAGDAPGDSATAERRLQELLHSARPKALDAGGARRLLLWLPRGGQHEQLQKLLAAGLEQKSSVALGIGGEAVFCYEGEQVSLPRLAARLIEYRRDLAEAADRLHARMDVEWSQLLTC